MTELRRCQEQSSGLCYVLLAADKYGFRPFPARIDAPHFDQIRSALHDPDELALLLRWFVLDENAQPPTWCLRSQEEAGDGGWWPVFERLSALLKRAAALVCPDARLRDAARSEHDWAKWFSLSVTEQEVHLGLLWDADADHRCFVFDRRITNVTAMASTLDSSARVRDYVDMVDTHVDEEAAVLLAEMRDTLVPAAVPEERRKCYTLAWDERNNEARLRTFADDFCSMMVKEVAQVLQKPTAAPDGPVDEAAAHMRFAAARARICVDTASSNAVVARVDGHLAAHGDAALVVHASSGVGKTSLMARCVVNASDSASADTWLLSRFVGTSASSSTTDGLVRSLCGQLRRLCETENAEQLPEAFDELVVEFREALSRACSQAHVWLFLDAVDQITDSTPLASWLPTSMCTSADGELRLVISVLDTDEHDCLAQLQAFRPEDAHAFVELRPPIADDRVRILTGMMGQTGRTMTAAQTAAVLGPFERDASLVLSPLYLRVASEMAQGWRSTTVVGELPTSIRALIDEVFDGLERTHGQVLVAAAFGALGVSRGGLTLNELEDVLSLCDDVLDSVFEWWTPPVRRLPPLLLTRLFTEVRPYMVQHGARVCWFHRQFREAAEAKYLGAESATRWHNELAGYFAGLFVAGRTHTDTASGLTSLEPRLVDAQPMCLRVGVPNPRRVIDLPHHLVASGERGLLGLKLWGFDLAAVGDPAVLAAGLVAAHRSQVLEHLGQGTLQRMVREVNNAQVVAQLLGCGECAAAAAHLQLVAPLVTQAQLGAVATRVVELTGDADADVRPPVVPLAVRGGYCLTYAAPHRPAGARGRGRAAARARVGGALAPGRRGPGPGLARLRDHQTAGAAARCAAGDL